MERVLITSGLSAFAQRVAKLCPDDSILFADSHAIPLPLLNSGKFNILPSVEDNSYVHKTLSLCIDLSIEVFIPLKEEEQIIFAKNKTLFKEYGILIAVPNSENLQNYSKHRNPTQLNCPEIIIRKSREDDRQKLGLYRKDNQEELLLCLS